MGKNEVLQIAIKTVVVTILVTTRHICANFSPKIVIFKSFALLLGCTVVRGQHFSLIAIMSKAGVIDFQAVTGAVTGDIFEQSVQCSILPHLMPFIWS